MKGSQVARVGVFAVEQSPAGSGRVRRYQAGRGPRPHDVLDVLHAAVVASVPRDHDPVGPGVDRDGRRGRLRLPRSDERDDLLDGRLGRRGGVRGGGDEGHRHGRLGVLAVRVVPGGADVLAKVGRGDGVYPEDGLVEVARDLGHVRRDAALVRADRGLRPVPADPGPLERRRRVGPGPAPQDGGASFLGGELPLGFDRDRFIWRKKKKKKPNKPKR